MKKILIASINFYQIFISSILHQITGTKNVCRFEETCSQFAKRSINEYGLLKGTTISMLRIFKCQPFYNKI